MDQLLPGTYYHIYNHANGNENLFRENENYRFFLQQYQKHIQPVADTLAYCLMPNHFHLLIKIRTTEEIVVAFPKLQTDGSSDLPRSTDLPGFQNLEGLIPPFISKQFSNLFNSYTKAVNKKYNRRGSLFIKNFKRKQITSDAHLVTAFIYIHVNPVHHGFTDQFTDWSWSSWRHLVDKEDSFLNRNEVIGLFGSLKEMTDQHLMTEKEKLRKMSMELE